MQQDHVDSKTEEKPAGTPIRGKSGPELTSQARAILRMQTAAGNRAMARVLADPAGGASVQRTATAGLSVQRDEWADALKRVLEKTPGVKQGLNLEELAQVLVGAYKSGGGQPLVGPKASPVPETAKAKPEGEVAKLTGETTTKPEAELSDEEFQNQVNAKKEALAKREKGPSEARLKAEKEMESLNAQEKRLGLQKRQQLLKRGKSPEERLLEQSDARLTAREQAAKDAEELRQSEAEARRPQTYQERANQATKERIDRLNKRKEENKARLAKRQELGELRRKASGRLTPQEVADQRLEDELEDLKKDAADKEEMRKWQRKAKPLNPGKKTLAELMKGSDKNPRVWRG